MRITGGVARGIPLTAPKGASLRPTSDRVRGALFQIVRDAVEGARALDLYAGTGALGIEALSRGAASCDFVEQDGRLCQAIRQNLERAGFSDKGQVHRARVEQALRFLKGPFQLVLLDPPYALAGAAEIMDGLGRLPLLAQEAVVVLEHGSRDAVQEDYGGLHMKTQRKYGDTSLSVYALTPSEEGT
ncbi:MAG: 16S rRNA (guanine(966)-N(2))-methyltransferase RsmD [Chloroflexi bacterium]|nr:16S rRNA (guanine(966)-N(2))-methyltransferase RsmD [Chloroflexota bacterium]